MFPRSSGISASPEGAFTAWVGDALQEVEMPNFDDIDLRGILQGLPRDSREFLVNYIASIHSVDASGQLKRLLEKLISADGLTSATLEGIGVRVLALLWALQSQKLDLCGMSQSELGQRIGKTKADISHWVKRNEQEFGIHARGQKMIESTKSYKKAARVGWKTRRDRNPEKLTESERAKALAQLVKANKKKNKNDINN